MVVTRANSVAFLCCYVLTVLSVILGAVLCMRDVEDEREEK